MSANTSIEWTATVNPDGTVTPGKTWNPVRGCSIVSPGCVNCYAMKQAHRFSGPGKPYEGLTKQTAAGPQWTGRITLVHHALLEPKSWLKPSRVFVNSMSDLFHEAVPESYILSVFTVMASCPQHTFQVLTKRPARMRALLSEWQEKGIAVLPNVWLGVSAEDQQRADQRIPELLETPAAVRFISAEPLLGPVDLRTGGEVTEVGHIDWLRGFDGSDPKIQALDWVIVGGESGAGARPCDLRWIERIVSDCEDAEVPVFVKQVGSDPRGRCDWEHHADVPPVMVDDDGVFTSVSGRPGTLCHAIDDAWWPCRLKTKNRKGGEPSDWPAGIRAREFPREASQ